MGLLDMPFHQFASSAEVHDCFLRLACMMNIDLIHYLLSCQMSNTTNVEIRPQGLVLIS